MRVDPAHPGDGLEGEVAVGVEKVRLHDVAVPRALHTHTGLNCTFNPDRSERYMATLEQTPHKRLQLARICSNLWTYKFASALGVHATSYLIFGSC